MSSENLPDNLRQIAAELDAEAESAPCSEAEMIREAAGRIAKLPVTADGVPITLGMKCWPVETCMGEYTRSDAESLAACAGEIVSVCRDHAWIGETAWLASQLYSTEDAARAALAPEAAKAVAQNEEMK